MTYDGRALARARETIRDKKTKNEEEAARRHREVFSRAPEIAGIDAEITGLMTGLALDALRRGLNAGEAVNKTREQMVCLKERRLEILSKLGLPGNYLDEIYSCEKCRDTGYVLGKPCSCLKAAYKNEASRELTSLLNLGRQSFESFDLSLYEPRFPGEKSGETRERALRLLSFCRGYAENFAENSRNLLFLGEPGLGKTFLSACVAKVVSEKGYSVVYDGCVAVMEAFEAQRFERGAGDAPDNSSRIRRYLGCDLMILDDLGTELTTSFTLSALYTLINTRLVGEKPTIISTNLSDDDLEKRYTPQIVSRLRGEYIPLLFKGRDIREVKSERGI